MGEFLASITWSGWALVALALATLWQMPAIVRMFLTGTFRDPRGRGAAGAHRRADTPPPPGDGDRP